MTIFVCFAVGVEVKLGNQPLEQFSSHWREAVMDSQLAGLLQQMLDNNPYTRPKAAHVAERLRDMYCTLAEQLDDT